MIAAEHNIAHPALAHSAMDSLVADAFRRPSWRIHRPRARSPVEPSLIVEAGSLKYLVQCKRSSEGRRDRVIPLLSQAILEAQLSASQSPEIFIPVAVIAAQYISPVVVEAVHQYASRVAPHIGIGLVDAQGLRVFWGHGLEVLNTQPSRMKQRAHRRIASQRLPHLFSDLNQWMLKLLLARLIPADLLEAPRARYRNPTELARAAGVSVMSAFRLVRQLKNENFLALEAEDLQLVRIPELLNRWSAQRYPIQEIPVRSLVQRDPSALVAALTAALKSRTSADPHLRACLGLFAAADALGFGFVHGVPPHIYMERYDPQILQRLGLSTANAGQIPDAFIRIPANPEALFRAALTKDGLPCADILQVWLDVSQHPSRGKAQAREIERRALPGLFANLPPKHSRKN